ncbi:MAG TPA: exodeoxyribonuclease III, partial [Anaerolineaceae bacterium]|nr:exodeoxyribonuclease III [Anaerolineaceae bacterium]
MKITTFNVNGIRAIVKKEGIGWIEDLDADVLGLQEIKAKPEQVPAKLNKLPGYKVIWNSAERPGYSGTAVFYRDEPKSVSLGIDYPMFDEEGRVIRLEYPDFFLYNIYFPNGG